VLGIDEVGRAQAAVEWRCRALPGGAGVDGVQEHAFGFKGADDAD